jgi:hypothetical protein
MGINKDAVSPEHQITHDDNTYARILFKLPMVRDHEDAPLLRPLGNLLTLTLLKQIHQGQIEELSSYHDSSKVLHSIWFVQYG